MPFNFDHLCNLPEKTLAQQYEEKLAKTRYDDRLDGSNEHILGLIHQKTNEQKKQLHIHLNAFNIELRNELIKQGFRHQLSYYVVCQTLRDLFVARNDSICDNITELYIESSVSEKLLISHLPSTLTHLYVQTNYPYKKDLSIKDYINIKYYSKIFTFSGHIRVV